MSTRTRPITAAQWWAALPLAQQVELLMGAPRIAGKWGTLGSDFAARSDVGRDGHNAAYLVWSCIQGEWTICIDGDFWGTRATLSAAQRAADDELLGDGWVLL
jgi:hypothetical protein